VLPELSPFENSLVIEDGVGAGNNNTGKMVKVKLTLEQATKAQKG
jgi:hypothetical protein